MSAEFPNSKKKRGRPAGPSASSGNASQEQSLQDNEIDHGEDRRPPKRSRKRKGDDDAVAEPTDGPSQPGSLRRSKRDRRSTDTQPWWVSGSRESNASDEVTREDEPRAAQPRRRAARSAVQPVAEEEAPPAEGQRRRRRVAKSTAGEPREEPDAENDAEPNRKVRRQLVGDGDTTTSKAPRKKPAQRRRSSRPLNVPEADKEPPPPKRRRPGNPSRTVSTDDDGADDLGTAEPPKYRHVESRTRQIPLSTISAKWSPLDEASVEAIDALISNTYRPVLLRLQGREQKHQQAHSILQAFASRVRVKLRKGIPFPLPARGSTSGKGATRPGAPDGGAGHADEFDFERTIDSTQSLEQALTPLLHSVALLEKEKEREERALEQDYENLKVLEANAKAAARTWRERGKRSHALALPAAEPHGLPDNGNGERLEILNHRRRPPSGLFKGTEDEEFIALSQQLGSHMESMRGNLEPVRELLPAIAKGRASLQAVLRSHLSQQQYENVILD